MWLGKNERTGIAMIKTIESEAELFALAEQVDLAEKTFHDALARRNEAQIAYLREPSIMTREAIEAAKIAEAVALEILNRPMAGQHSRHDGNRAQAEGVARHASTEGTLADSIVEDILQL